MSSKEKGFSLVELVLTMGLLTIVIALSASFFLDAMYQSADEDIMLQAQQAARAIADQMKFEIRMAGSGLPLGQSGFSANDSTLGDAPLPVTADSDDTSITFRSNVSGVTQMLISDFAPVPGQSSTMQVSGINGLKTGMIVYLSDASASGTAGLKGTISSIGSGSVMIGSGYVGTANATFKAGSMLGPAIEITYLSTPEGVRRVSEDGDQLLFPNSRFTLEYVNKNGVTMSMPLGAAAIADDLASVKMTVEVKGRRQLRSGGEYTATLKRIAALRNLYINR